MNIQPKNCVELILELIRFKLYASLKLDKNNPRCKVSMKTEVVTNTFSIYFVLSQIHPLSTLPYLINTCKPSRVRDWTPIIPKGFSNSPQPPLFQVS